VDSSRMFDYSAETQTQIPGFLSRLYEDEVARLLTYLQERRYAPGEYAIHTGDTDRSIFVVTSGSFESISPSRRGPQRSRLFNTGDVFGELAFLDGLPRSADVRAIDASEALVLSTAGFEHLRLSEPRLAFEFILDLGRVMSLRYRERSRKLGELGKY